MAQTVTVVALSAPTEMPVIQSPDDTSSKDESERRPGQSQLSPQMSRKLGYRREIIESAF